MYCDGGSRGNPGTAGGGAVLYDEKKKELGRKGVFCGRATNNVAEYSSLICGMELALENGITDLKVYMDSKLAIEQMKGNWKVKNVGLKPLFEKAKTLSEQFQKISFMHIPREKNSVADQIANKVMDAKVISQNIMCTFNKIRMKLSIEICTYFWVINRKFFKFGGEFDKISSRFNVLNMIF